MSDLALSTAGAEHTLFAMRTPRALTIVCAACVAVVLLVLLARGRPIREASPHARARPEHAGLPHVRACWIEYARNEAMGSVATADLMRTSPWEVTVAGLLVRSPRGDLVVDVGNSAAYRREIADYPLLQRAWLTLIPGSNRTVAPAPVALRGAGVNVDDVTVLLSHVHVDHAGGLVDLPKARVLLAGEELDFAMARREKGSIHVVPAHARALEGRASALRFAPQRYEIFDESADVLGDGSVVAVKLFGHTPGSIGIFVNVSPTLRLFHVGDAVNVVEAVERRLTKSIVMASTDNDGDAADRVVAQLAQLHEAAPEVVILPAHDRPAWARVFHGPGGCVE